MRVLHVISGIEPELGGPTAFLCGLLPAQKRAGLEVELACTFEQPSAAATKDCLNRAGIVCHLIGPARNPIVWHPRLAPTLQELIPRFDVVHIHALWEEIEHRAARMAMRTGKPYLFTPHGMLSPWSYGRGKWKKDLYMLLRLRKDLDHASAIHWTAQEECDLAGRFHLRPPPIVEPAGISSEEFAELPAKGLFRGRLAIPPYRPLVVSVGRLHPQKGMDLLIDAFADVLAKWPTTRPKPVLALIGPDDGGYERALRTQVSRLHADADVHFLGQLSGPAKLSAYVDADLFALASRHENFGIVIIEALACGCPVMISDKVNIHREITAAGVGIAVGHGALPDELYRWLIDPEPRSAAAARARAYATATFDWAPLAKRWAGHYERIMR